MHRFFVEQTLSVGEVSVLPATAHQIANVLRLRPGDTVALFDGSGGEWPAELVRVDPRVTIARLRGRQEPGREPSAALILCQALLKGDKFEWVLQKGTELGVSCFVPMVTQRTIAAGHARSRETVAVERRERWRRIVIEAAEQSGRTRVPAIAPPASIEAALRGPTPAMVCWEGESERPFGTAWREALANQPSDQPGVRVAIGPEGGLTAEEVVAAARAGATITSLGRRTLRSETAALAACAIALGGEAEYRSAMRESARQAPGRA